MQGDLPLLLFDLNGCLTSHTAARNSSGVTKLRPGIELLRGLQSRFTLGIYSSATVCAASRREREIK